MHQIRCSVYLGGRVLAVSRTHKDESHRAWCGLERRLGEAECIRWPELVTEERGGVHNCVSW